MCEHEELFCVLYLGRDSPTTNEGAEEQEETMPVPEDLSTSTGLQHNNRTDKPTGVWM